ncbi:hypothetical protein DDV21_002255 [Streptococcus chenjunshii]|uniref:Uncharacterized protein n=1 Tax=Streptococcus chenjunshii TaxID=2173853 RepID=A0A346NAD2_9STRE|nr:hypothetical protein DDV21_002255 [Streptococcus chenjunshii]RFU51779.1 hypothetical protein DDV22_01515 [Streptococcus chenjunshii]
MRSVAKTTKPSVSYGWLKLKSSVGRTYSFFSQRLGRVQFKQDRKVLKNHSKKHRSYKRVISGKSCRSFRRFLFYRLNNTLKRL